MDYEKRIRLEDWWTTIRGIRVKLTQLLFNLMDMGFILYYSIRSSQQRKPHW